MLFFYWILIIKILKLKGLIVNKKKKKTLGIKIVKFEMLRGCTYKRSLRIIAIKEKIR